MSSSDNSIYTSDQDNMLEFCYNCTSNENELHNPTQDVCFSDNDTSTASIDLSSNNGTSNYQNYEINNSNPPKISDDFFAGNQDSSRDNLTISYMLNISNNS